MFKIFGEGSCGNWKLTASHRNSSFFDDIKQSCQLSKFIHVICHLKSTFKFWQATFYHIWWTHVYRQQVYYYLLFVTIPFATFEIVTTLPTLVLLTTCDYHLLLVTLLPTLLYYNNYYLLKTILITSCDYYLLPIDTTPLLPLLVTGTYYVVLQLTAYFYFM